MGQSAGTLEERFERKVRRNDNEWGCDVWIGATHEAGYGRINDERVEGKPRAQHKAHILAWTWKNGPVPEGKELDHYRFPTACVGPRCCNNPDHLKPVTHRENSLRSLTAPPAINARRTHCPRGHEYTPENTYSRPGKPNGRECRICIRLRWKGLLQPAGEAT